MENSAVTNLMIAGVGGQGSILTSHLLTQTAIKVGKEVKLAETFGAATRGGSVMAHIRIGEVWAPMMSEDEADFILGLEPLEALRVGVEYIKPGGWVILNTVPWVPVDVYRGGAIYPSVEEIVAALKQLGAQVVTVNATALAIKAGDARAANSVLLGILFATGLLALDEAKLIEAMHERWSEKVFKLNQEAFALGKAYYKNYNHEN